MNGQDAKAACEFAAAVAALLAAGFWFWAASHPVEVPLGTPWGDSPQAMQMKKDAPKILRGASLNRIAAAFTGVSALFQFLVWLVPHLWCG
jgi:hypothetical protein